MTNNDDADGVQIVITAFFLAQPQANQHAILGHVIKKLHITVMLQQGNQDTIF